MKFGSYDCIYYLCGAFLHSGFSFSNFCWLNIGPPEMILSLTSLPLSRRFSCLHFSSEYLSPDYYLFHDKTSFFLLTIHKMVNGSSEFMCLPYVKNAKRALIYLTGGQPSNCSRHIEKEWSQREIF